MLQILSEWKDVLYFHPNIVCDCKGSALYHEVSGCAEEDAMHLLIYLYISIFIYSYNPIDFSQSFIFSLSIGQKRNYLGHIYF